MRFTNGFPYDITADSLGEAIYDLFGWECNNQPSSQQYSVYQTYEDISYEDNVDIHTSFCGHASLKNPQRLWEVDEANALTIERNPFQVSECIVLIITTAYITTK